MAHQADTTQDIASHIRARLAAIAERHADEKDAVLELVLLLDRLETAYRQHGADSVRQAKVGSPRRGKKKMYTRARRDGKWYLSERRGAGSQPYAVPQHIYDAAIHCLAAAKEPLAFPDINDCVSKRVGEELPDYLCRTVVRHWMSSSPPLSGISP